MFGFETGDADSPGAGDPTESPYLLSPVGRENPLGNTIVSPKRAPRKIARSPFKVLDAPALQDDFYLNLEDCSAQNVLAVGLGTCVYLWSACTSKVSCCSAVALQGMFQHWLDFISKAMTVATGSASML